MSHVFHIAPNPISVYKNGLLSPQSLYELDKQLFHEITFKGYENRTKSYLKKSSITDEDVLAYLNSPKRSPCTSRSIFFAFDTVENMQYINTSGTEYKLDIKSIKKYSIDDPILVLSKNMTKISWNEFEYNFDKYVKQAKQGALKQPDKYLRYKYILHFAVDCNNIPFRELIKTNNTKHISFPEEEIDNLSKSDSLYTHRVSSEYALYHIGDIVKTPWNKIYKITQRLEITNVKDSPLYKYLTNDQIKLISKYKQIAVLKLETIDNHVYSDVSMFKNVFNTNSLYKEPSTKNVQYLDQLRSLKLDNNKIIVGASASLVALDIKKEPNRDLDICIEQKYKTELLKKGILKEQYEDGFLHQIFPGTEIDAGRVDAPINYDFVSSIGTMKLDEFTFTNLPGLFRFYAWLRDNAPSEKHYQKRLVQLKMLTEYVSSVLDHKCYHSSPVSNLKEINARIAWSYKSRGPLVFASQSPIFSLLFGAKWNDSIFDLSWKITDVGFNPEIIFTLKQKIKYSEYDTPFSLYELSDVGFEQLLGEDCGTSYGHPMVEIVNSSKSVQVQKEFKFKSWIEAVLQLDKIGVIKFNNKQNLIVDVVKSNENIHNYNSMSQSKLINPIGGITMASIFDNYRAPRMTDATVEDPDYSEAELTTVEPEEEASKEEKDQVEMEGSTEALATLLANKQKIVTLRRDVAKRINKLSRLYRALKDDSRSFGRGRLSSSMKVILMEEGVVDSEIISDSAADDAKDALDESAPSEIAEKGATEEELAKASMRAQHKVLMSIYKTLK